MAANTTSALAHSAFALAGPAITNTIPPSFESLPRSNDLHSRIHQAHVRAHIRRIQALGLGLPSTMRQSQRTTRAVAHTVPPTTTTTTTTTITTTTNLTIRAPQPRRPLSALILNGLPTPPDTPAPAPAQPHTHTHAQTETPTQTQTRIRIQTQTQTQTQARPPALLPTHRSRDRAARTGFHGTGAGLSFGLDVFGDDDPVLSPRAPFRGEDEDEGESDVRRTPGAPARGGRTGSGGGYFQDATLTPASPKVEGEGEGENVFRAI